MAFLSKRSSRRDQELVISPRELLILNRGVIAITGTSAFPNATQPARVDTRYEQEI
jgi:hypothetical protein